MKLTNLLLSTVAPAAGCALIAGHEWKLALPSEATVGVENRAPTSNHTPANSVAANSTSWTPGLRAVLAASALAILLAACGGEQNAASPPTALPTSLVLSAPSARQPIGSSVAMSSNTSDPAHALSYHWDFGDGTGSTEAAPNHSYSRSGSYKVKLTVSNEAGASAEATTAVSIADLAVARGKICSGADSGGWCWQNPLPQGNLIRASAWLDEKQGWAVGDSGTILKTVDGGTTWTPEASGVDAALNTVLIVSASVVWVGGSNGLILITEDGGLTWRSASLGSADSQQNLRALDGRTAWLTTSSGSSMTTLDGGLSWRKVGHPDNTYSPIVQTSATQMWCASRDSRGALAMKRSLDGGTTWEVVPLPAPSDPGLYRSIGDFKFVDASRGFVVLSEYGYLSGSSSYVSRSIPMSTQDGGATWTRINPSTGGVANYSISYAMSPDGTLFSLGGYSGGYARSADAGITWTPVALPSSLGNSVQSFMPQSAGQIGVRDYGGRYYYTKDAGSTWTEPNGVTNRGITTGASSVWFFNPREGLVLTNDGNSLRTADGGQTWTPRTLVSPSSYGWRKLQFSADNSVGWAMSDSGDIYRSTDKGVTWLVPVPQSSSRLSAVLDFQFIDNNRGWALAYSYANAGVNLFTSNDGGLSWQSAAAVSNLAGMRSLRFGDTTHGVAVGPAGVAMVSSDAGATWRPRPTGSAHNLNQLAFIDSRTVIAVGDFGAILRSTDGGENWTRVASPSAFTLQDVRFVDDKLGRAVGASGTVLFTQDGGLSWVDVSVPTTATIQGSYFVDAYTGWVVGDNGTVLVTVTGGR